MDREKMITLVQKAQTGDTDAMDTLFTAYYNDIYYFAIKTIKDPDIACDVTQETFLRVIGAIRSLKEPAAFVPWMKQIAYHECARYFTKQKEVQAEEDEDGNTVFDTLADESTGSMPAEVLEQEEFQKIILEMIDQLSEEQRAAVLLYYFDEMSVGQIAGIQGVSEGTVKSRLNYARKSIKNSVETYEKKHGIKLHSIAFLPLLLLYFGKETIPTAKAEAIHATVMASAGSTTAATAAVGTGTAASASAGTAAAESGGFWATVTGLPLVTKIIAGAAAVGLLAGGAFLVFGGGDKSAETPQEPHTTGVVGTTQSTEQGTEKKENALFAEGLLAVEMDNKWGYVNQKGEWVIKPTFDHADRFSSNGLAAVYQDDKVGYINTAGQWVIEPVYDWVFSFGAFGGAEGRDLAKVGIKKGEKDAMGYELYQWGVVNTAGETVLEPIYDEVNICADDGMIRVEMGEKRGCFTLSGEVLLDVVYDGIAEINRDGVGLTEVEMDGKWGLIDLKGEWVVQPVYDSIDAFTNGFAKVERDGKIGYINTQGQEVIPAIYEKGWRFGEHGLVAVGTTVELNEGYRDIRFGYMNAQGQWVIQPRFVIAERFAPNGLAAVSEGSKIGYINTKGEWVIEPVYRGAWDFTSNGIAGATLKTKWGYINEQGQWLVEPIYREVRDFDEYGLGRVQLDFDWGFVNEQGETVLEPVYDNITYFEENGLAVIRKDGKEGLFSTEGKIVLEPRYDEIVLGSRYEIPEIFAANGLALVELDGKYGYINTKGEEVIAPVYDEATAFCDDGYAAVEVDRQWGIIDEKGQWLLEPQFEDVSI